MYFYYTLSLLLGLLLSHTRATPTAPFNPTLSRLYLPFTIQELPATSQLLLEFRADLRQLVNMTRAFLNLTGTPPRGQCTLHGAHSLLATPTTTPTYITPTPTPTYITPTPTPTNCSFNVLPFLLNLTSTYPQERERVRLLFTVHPLPPNPLTTLPFLKVDFTPDPGDKDVAPLLSRLSSRIRTRA